MASSLEKLETRCFFSVVTGPFAPVLPQLPISTMQSVTTVPASGELNPYGVAFVPEHFASGGPLHGGDVLVSNFNNAANSQGTGSTIVRETPDGKTSTFFNGAPGLGLSTALGVLRRGFVIVGAVPTSDGLHVAPPGKLLIIDRHGNIAQVFSDTTLLAGPWDLTVQDNGASALVFVSNVLTGTITRIDLAVPKSGTDVDIVSKTQIGSGYQFRTDPSAIVLGPTGLAYDAGHDVLYVAATADNAIYKIGDAGDRHHDAGRGQLVYQDDSHLHGPLGLTIAPNGDLITANGDAVNIDPAQNSELVEFTPDGHFVAQLQLDPKADAGFGVASSFDDGQLQFAAVNDNQNTVEIWTIGKKHTH